MIFDTFGFGVMLGMLIGSLMYLLMHKMMISDYDRRIDKMMNNFTDYLDKKNEDVEEVFEDG